MAKFFCKLLFGLITVLSITPLVTSAATSLAWPSNIFSLPASVTKADTIATLSVGKLFSSGSVYPISGAPIVYGLAVNATVHLPGPDSLVRLVLIDKNNDEYLLYEGYANLTGQGDFILSNFCDETCSLDGIMPAKIRFEINKGSVDLNSLSLLTVGEVKGASLKLQQDAFKISQLNQKNSVKWIAGQTSVSGLTYAQKKKLFATKDGKPLDSLPNLQGFEYYKGGIFEIKNSTTKSSLVSPNIIVPASYDWRNVNGENWLTSVKDQSGTSYCWAYSNLGTLESQINLFYNRHLDLNFSEQIQAACINSGEIPLLGGLPQECKENGRWKCRPGYNYCKIISVGIVDEGCNLSTQYPSHCDYNYICSNWADRTWKISDFHDYKFTSDYGTPSCDRQTMGLSENEFKKLLIEKGPLDSGIVSWNHAMVLIGYGFANNTNYWVFKNSYGSSWGENGYVKISLPLEDIYRGSLPIGPFTPPTNHAYWPAGFDGKAKCVDKDNDSYCNWGISGQPPAGTVCPVLCAKNSAGKFIKDCDDSNDKLGSFTSENNLNCAPITITCRDSDGGKNFNVKGTVTSVNSGANLSITDSCQSTSTLVEGYCDFSRNANSQKYACPYGCKNGACVMVTTATTGQTLVSAHNLLANILKVSGNLFGLIGR